METKRVKTSTYRLCEYKITEYDNGLLCWESHFGFAAEREGRCFLIGNILFLGPWESEKAGLFKREFFDHLKKLPQWEKTDYYSPHVEIYSCDNGWKVPLEAVHQNQMGKASSHGTEMSPQKPSGKASFSYRLNRYEIVRGRDDRVSWKTWGGSNKIRSGRCVIMEDILFIGSTDKEQTFLKKKYLSHLKSLPVWDCTRYYCRRLDLHSCKMRQGLRLEEDGGSPNIGPSIDIKGVFSKFPFAQKVASYDFISETISKIHSCRGRVYDIALTRLVAFLSCVGALTLDSLKKLKHKWKSK